MCTCVYLLSVQAHKHANSPLCLCSSYVAFFLSCVSVLLILRSHKNSDLDIINPLKPASICFACHYGAAPYVKVKFLIEGDIMDSPQHGSTRGKCSEKTCD